MAKLRIFVSSTCYDLGVIRSELRPFIIALGHEPVMSDYADILYDPRSHTHDSCIKEVPNCDMVVLIIGSRFGGTGITLALFVLAATLVQNATPQTAAALSVRHTQPRKITLCPQMISIHLGY